MGKYPDLQKKLAEREGFVTPKLNQHPANVASDQWIPQKQPIMA